ncbi:unnamed protein product [Prunus armeniaca]
MIGVVDPGLQRNNCSSIPDYPFADFRFSHQYPRLLYHIAMSSQPVTYIKLDLSLTLSLYSNDDHSLHLRWNSQAAHPFGLSQQLQGLLAQDEEHYDRYLAEFKIGAKHNDQSTLFDLILMIP